MAALAVLLVVLLPAGTMAQDADEETLSPIGREAFEVLRDFFVYDPAIPLDARIVDRVEGETSIREKVAFGGPRDSRVPAYLATPSGSAPPYPCVLLLHGIGDSKEAWFEPRIRAAVAAVTPILEEEHSALAAHNFAPYVGESRFLMLMGSEDSRNYSEKDARRLHALLGSPVKELSFYESGHRLPVDWTRVAVGENAVRRAIRVAWSPTRIPRTKKGGPSGAGRRRQPRRGSDQMIWPDAIGKAIESIESAEFLSAAQQRDIFYNNAARFLRLSDEEIARHHGH